MAYSDITTLFKKLASESFEETIQNYDDMLYTKLFKPLTDYKGKPGGREMLFPVEYYTNAGIGYSDLETDVYPLATANKSTEGSITGYFKTFAVSFTHKEIMQGITPDKVYIPDIMKDRVANMIDLFINWTNFEMFGDGDGTIGVIKTASASTTLSFEEEIYGVQWLQPGYQIDVLSGANAATKRNSAVVTVTDVDPRINQVTISAAVAGVQPGDRVVLAYTTDDTTGAYNGIVGFQDICSTDRTYLGINSSTYSWWNGQLQSHPDGDISITEEKLIEYEDDYLKVARRMPTLYVSNSTQKNKLVINNLEQRRFVDGTSSKKYEGGYDNDYKWKFNGHDWYIELSSPRNQILMLDTTKKGKLFKLEYKSDITWLSDDPNLEVDGAKFLGIQSAGTGSAARFLPLTNDFGIYYGVFGTKAPRCHKLITDLVSTY